MAEKRHHCEICNEGFVYPSKYRQHMASRSHKLLVESFSIRQSLYTQQDVHEEVEDIGCGSDSHDVDNEPEQETSELDDFDEVELEDLFEEVAEQSNGSFYPFPSKTFALLFMLVNSPQPLGEKNLSFVWFILNQLGIKTPSIATVKSFKWKLPKRQLPVRYLDKAGVPYYSISLSSTITQCLGRPDIACNLVRYPVEPAAAYKEVYHGNRWHTQPRYFSPMVTLSDGSSLFIRDCISFHHSDVGETVGLVVKFLHREIEKDTQLFALVDILVNIEQFRFLVPETTATHMHSDSLILCGQVFVPIYNIYGLANPPCCVVRWRSPNFERMDQQETALYFSPHPMKIKAGGKKIVMMPLVLFCDDTSGNVSKKWHKFESWYMELAGLPRHFNGHHENIHFICTSDQVTSIGMSKPIADELLVLESDGVSAYDALYKEEVLVIAPLLYIVCDNPMASLLCNHLGSTALMFCRMCMVQKALNPHLLCEKRTKGKALQCIAEIIAERTESKKVDLRKTYGLKEDSNPLLHMPCDIYECLPVEVLHTLLLGICKYLLSEFIPLLSPRQKEEVLARLRSFNQCGLPVRLHGNVCQYYKSFFGRDFKAWAQMAVFVMSPYLCSGHKEVLLSFSKVFHIAYCDFFAPHLYDEWQSMCQTFVNTVKTHMPHLLLKPKTHLILHLVDCMKEFGPSSAFSAERFESFNSNVRTYNVYGNRHAPSRDIAERFSVLQYLRYICNDGRLPDNKSCGDALKDLFHSKLMLHVMSGFPMKELQGSKSIYLPGAPRKKMKQCFQIHTMPLILEDGSTVTLAYVQQHGGYQIFDIATTQSEMVTTFSAVISQDAALVSCGDYVELALPYSEMQYGVLLAVFQIQTGSVLCLVMGFNSYGSFADQPIVNDHGCPLLELTKDIFATPSSNIKRPVSIVHECLDSCKMKEEQTSRTVEREEIVSTKLVYTHDWTNRMYCYNVYCVS